MAGQILGVDSKTFWRTARMLVWSLWVALAAALVFRIVTLPDGVPGLVVVLFVFVGLWIVAFHILERIRRG